MVKRKRLFFDIEVSMDLAVIFQPGRKISVDHHAIIKERAVICICYKWEGEKRVHSLQWDKNQCDRKLLIDFLKIANEADELVAHNGDAFDIKWIRGRCWIHQIPMFPKYVTIDTLTQSRRLFRLNSHRLDYMSKIQGSQGKGKTDFGMWVALTVSNPTAVLDKMVKYCKRDVLELQKVFTSMKPYMESKTHYGVQYGGEKIDCPECGGGTRINKTLISAAGIKKHQRVCNKCGRTHTVTAKAA